MTGILPKPHDDILIDTERGRVRLSLWLAGKDEPESTDVVAIDVREMGAARAISVSVPLWVWEAIAGRASGGE